MMALEEVRTELVGKILLHKGHGSLLRLRIIPVCPKRYTSHRNVTAAPLWNILSTVNSATAIPGMTNPEHLLENARYTAEGPLPGA
jgi:hypothetical protein